MPLAISRAAAIEQSRAGHFGKPAVRSAAQALRQRDQRHAPSAGRRRSRARRSRLRARPAGSRNRAPRSAAACSASSPSACAGSPGCTRSRAGSPAAASSVSPVLSIGRMRRWSVSGCSTTDRVLARLDDFVQVADRALAHGARERAVLPDRAVVADQKASDRSLAVRSSWHDTVTSGTLAAARPCARRSVSCRSRSGPLSMTASWRAWHCSKIATSSPVGR